METRLLLQTSGCPRSGNSYLNQALNLLYYPEESINLNNHDQEYFKSSKMTVVPFRDPLESISSDYIHWMSVLKSKNLKDIEDQYSHVNFSVESILDRVVYCYIDFNRSVLENISVICLMDFDRFTSDIEYIKNKIYKHFNLQYTAFVTDENIKSELLNGYHVNAMEKRDGNWVFNKVDRSANLPRDNKKEKEDVKKIVSAHRDFGICLDLYSKLKKIESEGEK